MKFGKGKNIYLDYASSAFVDRHVAKVLSQNDKLFANPNGMHRASLLARKGINSARDGVARALNAHADEIFFTGSGTESNAIAILGTIYKFIEARFPYLPHIVTTSIEHPSVIENCKLLENRGLAKVTFVNVETNGIVDLKKIAEAITDETVLVSVSYANNEIGTVQPIMEIAKIIRRVRKRKQDMQIVSRVGARGETVMREEFAYLVGAPFFHTDACQAMNYLFTENIEKLGVDLMTFNGSKIYGPKGIGVLYKKRAVEISPVYKGGGQEGGLRLGTEDAAKIIGVAKALEIANSIKEKEYNRLLALRDYFFTHISSIELETGYKIHINGDLANRLPNNINISVAGISNELLVIELDAKGIFVSSKSACKSDSEESSHVIHALRIAGDEFLSEESLRITLGRDTTKKDITILIQTLIKILKKYQNWK